MGGRHKDLWEGKSFRMCWLASMSSFGSMSLRVAWDSLGEVVGSHHSCWNSHIELKKLRFVAGRKDCKCRYCKIGCCNPDCNPDRNCRREPSVPGACIGYKTYLHAFENLKKAPKAFKKTPTENFQNETLVLDLQKPKFT
jgi:hypothetical protein